MRQNEGGERVVGQSMAALSENDRLEAPGLWRVDAEAQRQNVTVSVGDTSLVIQSDSGQALAHWSLAAVERVNKGQRPARFVPGEGAEEELEVADDSVADAIERVRRAVERTEPHPGRLRRFVIAAVSLLAIVALALWLPGAIVRHAARVVPDAKRAEIGAALFAHIRRSAGAPCTGVRGNDALAALDKRLRGLGAGVVRVMPQGLAEPIHLPGGTILLGRAAVEDVEEVEATAGYILAEDARATATDPMRALLDWAGPRMAFSLLTSGNVPSERLAAYSEAMLTRAPSEIEDEVLLARFESARVPARPYALARDISGESTLALIEADALVTTPDERLISDSDWIALQEICGG